MARRMRDLAFRDDQMARRYTGPVEPINRFIDDLGARDAAGHPPYIPPMYRGVDALALSISRDPGPKGLFRLKRATCFSRLRPAGIGGYTPTVYGGVG